MARYKMPEAKLPRVYLFHKDTPKGKIFRPDEVEALIKEGWTDTPANLDLPKDMDTGMTKEQVKNARPEDVVSYVESLGFFVMTQEQLQAQANKMSAGMVNIAADHLKLSHLPDEEIMAEVSSRGLNELDLSDIPDDVLIEELDKRTGTDAKETSLSKIDQFRADPKSLNKEDLVVLGNDNFSLGLRMNMKEDTLIAKINAALK
jgi:hypothetical protein